jgi:hypothetical protein
MFHSIRWTIQNGKIHKNFLISHLSQFAQQPPMPAMWPSVPGSALESL